MKSKSRGGLGTRLVCNLLLILSIKIINSFAFGTQDTIKASIIATQCIVVGPKMVRAQDEKLLCNK